MKPALEAAHLKAGTSSLGSLIRQRLTFSSLIDILQPSTEDDECSKERCPQGAPASEAVVPCRSGSHQAPLSHAQLKRLVSDGLGLHAFGIGRGDSVVVLLPNGPELATCLLMCMARHVCVPVNPQSSPQAAVNEVTACRARAVIVPEPATGSVSCNGGAAISTREPQDSMQITASNSPCAFLPAGVIQALLGIPGVLVFALVPDDGGACGSFKLSLIQIDRGTCGSFELSPTPGLSYHTATPHTLQHGAIPHQPASQAMPPRCTAPLHTPLSSSSPSSALPYPQPSLNPSLSGNPAHTPFSTATRTPNTPDPSYLYGLLPQPPVPASKPPVPLLHPSGGSCPLPSGGDLVPAATLCKEVHPSFTPSLSQLLPPDSALQAEHYTEKSAERAAAAIQTGGASVASALARSGALPVSMGAKAEAIDQQQLQQPRCGTHKTSKQSEQRQQQQQCGTYDTSKFDLNGPSDACLVLASSGTTGTKKVVPYTLEMLAVSAGCVIASWDLQPTDLGVNMMPLWHAGGIIRNLLAPLLAGGAMCFAPAFNADLFCEIVAHNPRISWYYAAPTMHRLIVEGARNLPAHQRQLRLICSAASALPGPLAHSLRHLFGATVLPCYGMTECLPITCPPPGYALERPGSCGMACGPEVACFDTNHRCVPPGEIGRICVRGPPLFLAYDPHATPAKAGPSQAISPKYPSRLSCLSKKGSLPASNPSFLPLPSQGAQMPPSARQHSHWVDFDGFEGQPEHSHHWQQQQQQEQQQEQQQQLGEVHAPRNAFHQQGWFDTGDLGFMDADGYLYICGRSKEAIDTGGEMVSCIEVEEAVLKALGDQHPELYAVAFAVPHTLLQEAVGLAMVMPSKTRPDLAELHHALAPLLPPFKWPAVIVFMDQLPCNMVGKPERIDLARRLQLAAISEDTPVDERIFEAKLNHDCMMDASIPIPCQPAGHNQVSTEQIQEIQGGVPNMQGLVCKFDDESSCNSSSSSSSSNSSSIVIVSRQAEIEGFLQHLWMQILHLPTPPSLDQEFSALGGTSLSMGRLLHSLRSNFRCFIPFTFIFPSKTIRAQAAVIANVLEAAADPPASLLPNAEPTALPASDLGQSMQQETNGLADEKCVCQWQTGIASSPWAGQSEAGVRPAQLSDSIMRKVLCEPCRENLHHANLIVKPREVEELQAQICKQQQTPRLNEGDGLPCPALPWPGSWIIGRSVSLAAMVVQIMPLAFIHPLLFTLRRAAFLAGFTQLWPRYSQEPHAISLPLLPLIISWLLMWAMSSVALPIGGVAMKWLLVWRFKAGRWPLWSCFYLRSWLVQQLLFICGRGAWAAHPALLRFYYQLLGARIGSGVVIDPQAKLFNHDLLAIGDNCCVDGNVRLQAAAYEYGHITLQPITIGPGCCLATGCCIAPGTNLSSGCCLPPMTSSHDVPYPYNDPWRHKVQGVLSGLGTLKGPVQGDAWGHMYRPFCRSTFPAPGLLFRLIFVWPMLLIVKFALPRVPALAFIFLMLSSVKLRADSQLELWVASFMVPQRLLFLFAATIAQRVLAPLVFLLGMILLKRIVIGKFEPGPRAGSLAGKAYTNSNADTCCELGSLSVNALKGQYQPCRRSSSNLSSVQDFQLARGSSGALSRTSSCSSLGLHVSNSTDCLIPEIDARPLPPHVPPHPAKRAPGEGIQGATTAVLSSVRTWGAWASAVVERGCANASVQWQLTRHEVMEQLVGSRHWREVCWLLGPHYELISLVYRALGAKVGRNVYWPGTGIGGLGAFDLLEIGDDVVFGSRCSFMLCDAHNARPICIEAGAMVADRCVLLPGTHVGRNAMLGSGCTTLPGGTYAGGGVWVGSRGGEGVCLVPANPEDAAKSTVKPFGRAVYLGQATYPLLPHWIWPIFNIASEATLSAFHLTPTLALVQALLWAQQHKQVNWRYTTILLAMWAGRASMVIPLALFALLVTAGAKWLLVGSRTHGRYAWDISSYCQRWQVLIAVSRILSRGFEGRGPLSLLGGSIYIVWAFRLLGARIGRDVCLYPHGADPAMTEPDLVTIGNGACIDDAALVAHINARGNFELNQVAVGQGAVLRAGSRLMSGATMETNARLLEGALCVSGEVMEQGTTWKGAPAHPCT